MYCSIGKNKHLNGGHMAKKKKEETMEEIIDRIDDDLQKLRDKVWEMEADDQVEDEDYDSEDEDEDEE
jgi:hypothetical protein